MINKEVNMDLKCKVNTVGYKFYLKNDTSYMYNVINA